MHKLKVLLINPPIKPKSPPYNIPLGLACIAAVIDAKGHDVAIFDNNAYRLGNDEIIRQIRDIQWDMICLGNLVTTYPWQKELLKRLRREFPHAILQVGGGLATSLQDNLMEWIPEIDILVIGEGERTVSQILDNFNNRSWDNVKGILYRKQEKIHRTAPQQLLTEKELSELPFPKLDLLPLEEVYFKHSGIPLCPEAMVSKRRISIEASRGCPFTCSFCIDLPSGSPRDLTHSDEKSLHRNEDAQKKKIRYFDPERVIEHIKYLRLKYAIDFITFTDENFTVNKSHVLRFCDLMIKEGLTELEPRLQFSTTAHVNTLDREMLEKLKEAGCCALDLGLESMSRQLLAGDICKKSTPEKNLWGFNQCIDVGIYPITNFIIGLPNEDAQSVYDSTKFLVENEIECGPFFVTPYPMTGLFERCKDEIIRNFGSLEKFVIACEQDVSSDFVVNLTKYNDAELLGLRQMVINHDLEAIRKFAGQIGEKVED
jgi:anaerobic magnesium-protoporphyrin IX monomethyl ester cyclase